MPSRGGVTAVRGQEREVRGPAPRLRPGAARVPGVPALQEAAQVRLAGCGFAYAPSGGRAGAGGPRGSPSVGPSVFRCHFPAPGGPAATQLQLRREEREETGGEASPGPPASSGPPAGMGRGVYRFTTGSAVESPGNFFLNADSRAPPPGDPVRRSGGGTRARSFLEGPAAVGCTAGFMNCWSKACENVPLMPDDLKRLRSGCCPFWPLVLD